MTSVAPITLRDVLPTVSGEMFLDDTVFTQPNTRPSELLARQQLTVRNGHRQAAGDVAPDLTVYARQAPFNSLLARATVYQGA